MRDTELRFLLDENVKKELLKFLNSAGYDSTFKPKGLANGELAAFSKSEKRVLVTNDFHFADPLKFPKDKIFSVVWLRVPQDKPEVLLNSFSKLLKDKSEPKDFEGFLITLNDGEFEVSDILSSSEFKFSK